MVNRLISCRLTFPLWSFFSKVKESVFLKAQKLIWWWLLANAVEMGLFIALKVSLILLCFYQLPFQVQKLNNWRNNAIINAMKFKTIKNSNHLLLLRILITTPQQFLRYIFSAYNNFIPNIVAYSHSDPATMFWETDLEKKYNGIFRNLCYEAV